MYQDVLMQQHGDKANMHALIGHYLSMKSCVCL